MVAGGASSCHCTDKPLTKMKKEVYIAANKSGQIRVFTDMPERNEHFGMWVGDSMGCISTIFMIYEADGLVLPPLTFKDEPRKYTITIEEVP